MAAKPSSDSSFAFMAGGVRMKSGTSGRKTFRGCGSKVSASAGTPRRSASSSARSKHRLMAAMHAVEIADRHHAAAQAPFERGAAGNVLKGHAHRSFGIMATIWNPCLSRNA